MLFLQPSSVCGVSFASGNIRGRSLAAAFRYLLGGAGGRFCSERLAQYTKHIAAVRQQILAAVCIMAYTHDTR